MTRRFDDGKEADALRTIGEVSEGLGIKAHVLRYWEQQFPMLNPLKRSGGRRYYRSEDIAMVEMIDRLVNHEGYTLKGAKAVIRSGKQAQDARHQSEAAPGAKAAVGSAAQTSAIPLGERAEMGRGADATGVSGAAGGPQADEIVTQLKAIRKKIAAVLEV